MHEAGDADIPALLFAVVTVVVVSLFLSHRVKARAARKVEILKLQRFAAAEAARVEAEEYTSMLAASNVSGNGNISESPECGGITSVTENHPLNSPSSNSKSATSLSLCTICSNPTSSRCSRCKAVRYCSSKCQIQDWREGHRLVCREVEVPSEKYKKELLSVEDSENSICTTTDSLDNNVESADENLVFKSNKTLASVAPDESLPRPLKILFPYEHFLKLFTWDRLQLPPCGLINCGNSCFANVVLQCLTYTRPLAAYLLQGSHVEKCRRNDWCFMCELQYHVVRVKESRSPFSPIRILSRIRNIGNHLGYGRQEDAHEFMRFAIDSMQSICLDEAGGERELDPRTKETTFIQHVFGGHLQSQVKCTQCYHESDRYENMMDLAVEIQGNVESLEDALAQFTAPEWLDGENKYKCDRCNSYVKARKRLTVHEAPNILTITFKRFQGGKFGKLNKRVTFPEVLDIAPYMSGKGDKPPLYQLYAVVVHVDMLNASFFGHYVCFVKDLHGSWYKVDDSKVTEVELEKVMQQRAYMLLYARSAPRPAPTVDGDGTGKTSMAVKVGDYYGSGRMLPNGNHVRVPTVLEPSALSNGAASNNGWIESFAGGCGDTGNGRSSRRSGDAKCSLSFSQVMATSMDLDQVSTMQDFVNMDHQTLMNASRFPEDSSCTLSRDGVKNLSISVTSASSHLIESEVTVRVITEHNPSPESVVSLRSQQPSCSHSAKVDEVLHGGLSPSPPQRSLADEHHPSWPTTSHSRSSSCPAVLTLDSSLSGPFWCPPTKKIKPFLLSQVAIFCFSNLICYLHGVNPLQFFL